MATIPIFESAENPLELEAKINAKFAEHTNCVLTHWNLGVEGTEIFVLGELETIVPERAYVERALQFKAFGGQLLENVNNEYVAWRYSDVGIQILDKQMTTVGTYNVIAVMYRRNRYA